MSEQAPNPVVDAETFHNTLKEADEAGLSHLGVVTETDDVKVVTDAQGVRKRYEPGVGDYTVQLSHQYSDERNKGVAYASFDNHIQTKYRKDTGGNHVPHLEHKSGDPSVEVTRWNTNPTSKKVVRHSSILTGDRAKRANQILHARFERQAQEAVAKAHADREEN